MIRKVWPACLVLLLFALVPGTQSLAAPSQGSPPSPLTATGASSSQIDLSWADANNDDGYAIERSLSSTSGFTQIALTPKDVTSYRDGGLSSGRTYYYQVRASLKNGGFSEYSNVAGAATLNAPPAVSITSPASGTNYVTAQTVSINATATDDVGVTKVEFYDGGYLKGTDTTAPYSVAWTITSVANGSHNWRAKAYDAGGASTLSAAVTLSVNISTVDTTAPSVPSGLAAVATSCSQITLSWNASTDNLGGSGVAGYKVYRNGTQIADTTATANGSFGLSASTSYSFRVAAYDNAGNLSAQSTATSATTPACSDTTPPSVPTGLTAVAASCTQVNLAWNASTDNTGGSGVAGYRVYRNGAQIAQTTSTSFNSSGQSGSTFYSFTVAAYDYAGYSSAQSAAATVTTPACTSLPAAPGGLSASAVSSSQINLAWIDYATNESGFKVERATSSAGPWTQIATLGVNVVSYQSTGLASSTTYYFRVRAYNTGGNSAYSNTASATTQAGTPTAPNAPSSLTAGAASSSQINLAWVDNATNESGFKIERATTSSGPWTQIATVGVNIVATQITGLASSTTYYFRIRAYNTGGDSAYSNTTSATTLSGNQPPVAKAGSDQSINLGSAVTLNGSASYDPDGSIVSYNWTFGDGGSASGVNVSHTYAATGTYTTTLTVTDNAGASSSDSALVTVVSSGPGALVWSDRHGSVSGDVAQAVAVDPSDNILMAGQFSGTTNVGGVVLTSAGGSDILLAKFTTAGDNLWAKRYGSIGGETVRGLAVDYNGDLLLTGYFSGVTDLGGGALTSAGGYDIFLAKYSGVDGRHLWSKRFGDVYSDIGYSIAVDYRGDVMITGFFTGTVSFGGAALTSASGGPDTMVAKFSGLSGSHIWSKRFLNDSPDAGMGIAVNGNGDVLVTGYFAGQENFGGSVLVTAGLEDIFVAKLSGLDGAHLWSKRFGGTGNEEGTGIAVDGSDNVVLTGYFKSASVDFGGASLANPGVLGIFLAKLSGGNGSHLWSRRLGSGSIAVATAVSVDPTGNTMLAGYFQSTADLGGGTLTSDGGYDIFVAKYAASTGTHMWSKGYGSTSDDFAYGLSVDGNGQSAVAGYFWGPLDFGTGTLTPVGGADIFLIKLWP